MLSKNDKDTLITVLTKMLGADIINAGCQDAQLYLQGGMSGVKLIEGMAETVGGEKLPYKIILKVQQRRRPPSNPDLWTTEYYVYQSDLYKAFDAQIPVRMLKCYHSEISDDVYSLWLEYADGVTDEALTLDNLEYIAEKFGSFQGRVYSQPELLKNIERLSKGGFIREYYEYQASEHDYLRSGKCDLPNHLKQMLIDADDNKAMIFQKFSSLPPVLCHGDFYISNIILKNDEVILIDWGDGAGWGYIGEDIANLIVDSTDIKYWGEYYRRLIPAYLKGLSKYMNVSALDNIYFREMVIIRSGHDCLYRYMHARSPEEKTEQITALQKIYDMGK
jgi:thiamine kinase-like enzyme